MEKRDEINFIRRFHIVIVNNDANKLKMCTRILRFYNTMILGGLFHIEEF